MEGTDYQEFLKEADVNVPGMIQGGRTGTALVAIRHSSSGANGK